MVVNDVLRLVPTPLTAVIIAIAIPVAIRPYSIAVAPESSDKKLNKIRFNTASFSTPLFGHRETTGKNLKVY
jgi:hypothetical protein